MLGPKHSVSELSSLLNGPLLTRWEDKAKELASSHLCVTGNITPGAGIPTRPYVVLRPVCCHH